VLEIQGDLLRVRRFPEDALDYYNYALERGGDRAELFNKMGITQMELGNIPVAKAYFERVIKLRKKDPQAWNNLGAVQFSEHNYSGAILCYRRAIKLNKKYAVSHSNLGLAYIEQKDLSAAKNELSLALQLDPQIFEHNSSAGVSLHTMSASDRANFCFQMAKVYARSGNEEAMLHQLQTASEAGMDVRGEMSDDHDLAAYRNDPRVLDLVKVAKSLRESKVARSTVATALPAAAVALPTAAPTR
jgi:tetratricopeptide (TPR) repeat protein